ncbi:hypothetical protein PAXRUDRAFT_179801, partial [Paxillus rubicundulus Ve08.2h10]
KSQTKKKQVLSEHQEEALSDAINTYLEQQKKPEEDGRSFGMSNENKEMNELM